MIAKKTLWICSVTFFLLDHALAQQRDYSWGMGHGMMDNWGIGGFGMVFMMIFWVLVIVGLVLLVKWLIQAAGSGKAAGQKGAGARLFFSISGRPGVSIAGLKCRIWKICTKNLKTKILQWSLLTCRSRPAR